VLLDLTEQWEHLDALGRFVHHVVRAGQIVDDILDHERDVSTGNHSWVARRLGSLDAPEKMTEQLVLGQIDELVAVIDRDLEIAHDAARSLGMSQAVEWLTDRRRAVHGLAERILRSALMD